MCAHASPFITFPRGSESTEISGKTKFDIYGMKVSMWVKYEFETVFTSNDVMNFQGGIGKGFWSR